jgi:GT2 family glycosyltransferase
VISIVILSKDEPALGDTLGEVAKQAHDAGKPFEIVVVDASEGRLDYIRKRHEEQVRWMQFQQPPGVKVSIAHQRNAGVRAAHGGIIVFTDAGCRPQAGWLTLLLAPFQLGEYVTAGLVRSVSGDSGVYDAWTQPVQASSYVFECGSGNLAFRRAAFEAVGGFDEAFAYGSDVDFSWRLVDAGYRIRSVPDAIIHHDFGTWRRQLRRSYVYGKARARLYRKHPARMRQALRKDPVVVVYPIFLLGLPLTFIFPLYPALLLIPAWRNRAQGSVKVVVDHLTFGAGVLAELVR